MEESTASRNDNKTSNSPQKLIIMCGPPGTGKTTTAHRIRQALDDTIVVSREFFRNPSYRGNACLDEFSNGSAAIFDRRFYAGVEQLLSIYTTAILDATFRESVKRQTALDFAQKHGCQSFIIECISSHDVLLSRLRRQMLSGQKNFLRSPEEVLEYYINNTQEPENKLDGVSFIRFDTEKKRIVWKSLQDYSCKFVEQLVEILERPFALSLFESFPKVASQEIILPTEISLSHFPRTNKDFRLHQSKDSKTRKSTASKSSTLVESLI